MKKKSIIVIGIIIVIAIVTGISYALWKAVLYQSGENVVTSSCFDLTFEETEGIHLTNSMPIYDIEGKRLKPYKVTVTNHCNRKVDYQVNFETTSNTTMKDQYIKLMVNEREPRILNQYEETSTTISNGKSAYKIDTGEIDGNSSIEYEIRIWMDENVTQEDEGAMNGVFEGKITVTASYITTYTEEILNGTDPVLKDGLIPVTIGEDGTVYRANPSEEWYNYVNQKWANAVILEDESQDYYYHEEIPEENIESYFVWIPRYKYKLFNLGNYSNTVTSKTDATQTIEIEFENKDTALSEGANVGDWLSHPAFQSFDTNGFWVGKFEVGYKGAVSTTGAEKNENNPDKIQIKPNVYSWRSITVANAFASSYNYKREYDSHMMKNTEWGAVAYLQHSVYGSRSSVRVNNNSNYITGYAAKNEPTCGYTANSSACNVYEGTSLGIDGTNTYNYNNPLSAVASTTNNHTGVYDMSSGAFEYVMGYTTKASKVGGSSSITTLYSDFFTNPEWQKYYDSYQTTIFTAFNGRILGDATGEMGPFTLDSRNVVFGSWYSDSGYFADNAFPWFGRGGTYQHGISAGVFYFNHISGGANRTYSFRLVLNA